MPDRPDIVCICGSTRFVDEMRAANRDLTFAGVIVLAPAEADGPVTDEQKTALDALHLRKIDLADRVLVVNPGGYVGESTSREIAHAHATGKPVAFTDPGGQSCLHGSDLPQNRSSARSCSSQARGSSTSSHVTAG